MDKLTISDDRTGAHEELSAFADGELAEGRVAHACQQWRADGEWRAAWHAYHLIGDVLRSDDLASDPVRDSEFLSQLRTRLAEEPVVLAPPTAADRASAAPWVDRMSAGRAAARPGRSWRASSAVAVAAGFVAVAGVLVLTRAPAPVAPLLAGGSTAAPLAVTSADLRTASATATPAPPLSATSGDAVAGAGLRASIASGKLIRDVRLDRYLAAHKEFAGSSALGVPSGFLRNATADASDR